MTAASRHEHHEHGPRSWVPLAWPETDLRRAMAPRAPAETGSAPDDTGRRQVG